MLSSIKSGERRVQEGDGDGDGTLLAEQRNGEQDDDDDDDDDDNMGARFSELLALAADRFTRVVVVLDNVDLLHGVKQRGAGDVLAFLPRRPPANVRIVLAAGCPPRARAATPEPTSSSLSATGSDERGPWAIYDALRSRADATLVAAGFDVGGRSLAQAVFERNKPRDARLDDAAADAVRRCVVAHCQRAGKQLPPALLEQLAASAACQRSPRYLTLLLDELLAVGSHDTLASQLSNVCFGFDRLLLLLL
jgi:hypothetical protein